MIYRQLLLKRRCSVYRLRPDGGLDCLISNVPSPNGLVLNREENVLYVAVTRGNCIWRMPLMRDGSVSKVGLFFQFFGSSGPDGLALDEEDNLVVAHASMGSTSLLSRRNEVLSYIRSCQGATVTNAAIGGPDRRRKLYLTQSETRAVLVFRMPAPGRQMYSHR